MKLPFAEQAIIPEAKLRDYLVSTNHPIGRHKSVFFAALGYNAGNWPQLEADLRSQHLKSDAELGERTEYGQKYLIRSPLIGPNGRQANVLSVWMVRDEEQVPRFVSAMPA